MKRSFAATLGVLVLLPLLMAPIGSRPQPPAPTAIGTFMGTWYYTDPEYNIAIFIKRHPSGSLDMRYHVLKKGGQEYETDAGGYAKYLEGQDVVEILFSGAPDAEEHLKGHHERTTTAKDGTLVESSDFDLYRAEGGRKLILLYDEWKVESIDREGNARTLDATKGLFRVFRKASDLVLGFDEIPF